ncbi:hypothetical protein BGZ98_002967 [Dissophora globulifera]|nr:hypothetical protein BGZ98_002967 [Dissophora globulifera]
MSNVPITQIPSWGRLGDIPPCTPEMLIGKGTFGEVYLWNKDGIQMAVKRVQVTDGCAADIERETNIVSQLAHKHIIQCYGVDRDANYVFIITDYAEGGNLDDAAPRLDWDDKKRIVVEVAHGLAYLHNQGIIHRDIKGGNILLTKHDEAKLCDFGIAKVRASATCASSFVRKGTPRFMAPELRRARPAYSTMSDVYALGVVMKELVHGVWTPADYTAIMNRCLNEDPEKRPSVEEIVGAFHVVHRVHNMDAEGDPLKTEQGPSPDEEFLLGCKLYFGDGVDVNHAKGVEMTLRSAYKGHKEAQTNMGQFYQIGFGVLPDYTKAVKWLHMAADNDHAAAQTELGKIYIRGVIAPQDYSRALELFQAAASQGHIEACTYLGQMYAAGLGIEKNYKEAMLWLRVAADRGHAEAQVNIGDMYYDGLGVKRDYTESKKFHLMAASQGDLKAYLALGDMYNFGHGVPQDDREALEWWLKAAKEGDMVAQYRVGHGGQAEVFKAKCNNGLDDVVVKMFLNSDDKDWRREVEFAKRVRCRHIVQFYHVEQDRLVMEYVEGGSLSNAILMSSIEDWETKTQIAKQVSLGLTYLHGQNIIHCDIKSANILLTKDLDAKICDFGRARTVGQSGGDGTLPWMAPELLLEPPQYSCKSDVYALGMVMWEMASGCIQPYQEHVQDSMIDCIVNGITEDIPSNTPEAYTACIQACWHQKPEERPAAAEIFPDINYISQDHDIDDLRVPEDEVDKNLRLPTAFGRNETSLYKTLGEIYYDGYGVKKDYKKSMEWYLKASDTGNSDAMFNIGLMYQNGYGVEQNYAKAMEWFLKASDTGNSDAMHNIGVMYRNGEGVEQDHTMAMEWFVKASDAGHSDAMLNIGVMYDNGDGVEQDYTMAMEWFVKASDSGHSDAMFNIGVMYRNGHGVERDYIMAMEWFLKASDAGHSSAMFNIGLMYHKGYGVEQDCTKAMEWYLKASNAGDPHAKFNIGAMYDDGDGIEQNYTKAMEWYLKASDAGDSDAKVNIGMMYSNGYGVEQDYTRAMEWYLKASDSGDSDAKVNIGMMYHDGHGVPQDYTKAMEWQLKASDIGNSTAMSNIGEMYRDGRGVEQDYTMAMGWYLKASDAEDPEAKLDIGHMYREGLGVEKDYNKAMVWFLEASHAGVAEADLEIGHMFNEGFGVAQDPSQAFMWYLRAAEQGFVPAYPLLSGAYLEGVVATKDDHEAEMWASKAVREAEPWLQTLHGQHFSGTTWRKKKFTDAVESCKKLVDNMARKYIES